MLHDVQWRGRTFQVAIGPLTTRMTLTSGAPLPVTTPGACGGFVAATPC